MKRAKEQEIWRTGNKRGRGKEQAAYRLWGQYVYTGEKGGKASLLPIHPRLILHQNEEAIRTLFRIIRARTSSFPLSHLLFSCPLLLPTTTILVPVIYADFNYEKRDTGQNPFGAKSLDFPKIRFQLCYSKHYMFVGGLNSNLYTRFCRYIHINNWLWNTIIFFFFFISKLIWFLIAYLFYRKMFFEEIKNYRWWRYRIF